MQGLAAVLAAFVALSLFLPLGIAALLVLAAGVIGAAAFFLLGWGGVAFHKANVRDRKAFERKQAIAALKDEALLMHRNLAAPVPAAHEFLEVLAEALAFEIERLTLPTPPAPVLMALMAGAKDIYEHDIPRPPVALPALDTDIAVEMFHAEMKRRTEARAKFDPAILGKACVESFLVFLKALPEMRHPQFELPAKEVLAVAETVRAMQQPFYAPALTSRNLGGMVRDASRQGAIIVTGKRGKRGSPLVYARGYGEDDAHTVYLPHSLARAFEAPVPWGPPDAARFAHQWVRADTGSGKTILLSAQIERDLDRVAAGECALFIMDTKDKELTYHLPRLKRFAPGGDLDGKLIYLEPDIDFPLALNILDFKNGNERVAEQMLLSFISVAADTSMHMENIIRSSLRVLSKIPGANIVTFKDLLFHGTKLTGFDNLTALYPGLRERLDEGTRRFFTREHVYGAAYSSSLPAVYARLDSFTSDALFEAIFTPSASRLDLADKLSKPHVVIVNAAFSKLHTIVEPFGRYFISRIFQLVLERGARRAKPLPLFCYIDECQNFIGNDPTISKILTQARDQNVGMILSHQLMEDVEKVAGALANCNIKCEPVREGLWYFDIRERYGRVTYSVPVKHADFKNETKYPHMTPDEWSVILNRMRDDYCSEPATLSPAPAQTHDRP